MLNVYETDENKSKSERSPTQTPTEQESSSHIESKCVGEPFEYQ